MANLTPELLARIQAYYAQPTSGSGWSPNMQTPYQEGGQVYQQDGGFINAYDPNRQEAGQDQFNVYNPDGTFSNEGTFKTDDWQQTLLMALAAAGGMQFLPGGAFGGGAGGAAGAAGDAYLPGQLGVDGANLSASIPGTSFMNSSGINTVLEGAGLTGTGAGASGGSSTFLGEGVASGVPAWDAAAKAAGGAAKYLGPAATLLGGLAGAQGQKNETTSERKTDPRVDPYLFGANGQPGLLQMTYDKLAGQMKPGGLQGYDDMQRVGMGLLNAPVAGNGFGLFTKGRY